MHTRLRILIRNFFLFLIIHAGGKQAGRGVDHLAVHLQPGPAGVAYAGAHHGLAVAQRANHISRDGAGLIPQIHLIPRRDRLAHVLENHTRRFAGPVVRLRASGACRLP